DIKLTTAGTKSAAPSCPTFVGGDRVTKLTNQGTDRCFYFWTTDIVSSEYKGSNTDYEENYRFGVPAPVEKCGGGASSGAGNSTSTTPVATTKAPTPAAPTKTPMPSTTKPTVAPAEAPVDGEATKAPTTPAPKKTRTPHPRRTKTPAPSKDAVGGDAEDEDATTPAPATTKVPSCKASSAK
ncbi:hypothetical protein Gpo141_00014699, partial [Globisporangium polare]